MDAAADGIVATAGPDAFRLSTPLPLSIEDGSVRSEFVIAAGARERLTLTWHLSYEQTAAGRGRQLGARADGGVVARVERPVQL